MYTTEQLEEMMETKPLDNRRAPLATLRAKYTTGMQFWLRPALFNWIEHNILSRGWTWRQFTEAAIMSVFSPQWVHLTWHHNFDARGQYNRPLDPEVRAKLVGWTPFLDEIPHARTHEIGIEPYDPSSQSRHTTDRARLALRGGSAALYHGTARHQTTIASTIGSVYFSWHGQQHAFLAELGKLTPVVDNSPRRAIERRGSRTLAPARVACLCINAHFERNGVHALYEAMFQVWREYAMYRNGMQSVVPTAADTYDRMMRRGIGVQERVPLWSASDAPLPVEWQASLGFWPDNVLQRLYRPWRPHPAQDEDR